MPLFKRDEEQEAREAAELGAVRSMPVSELAAEILERVFGPAEGELSPNMIFSGFQNACGVDL